MSNDVIRTVTSEIVVLGAGPAGLAAALSAHSEGAQVLIIERENRCGGILKQCIHDGFGLIRYKEKLTGPEYALRDYKKAVTNKITILTNTFVIDVRKDAQKYLLYCMNEQGAFIAEASALILATGCRERTDRQIFLHGERPAGIYTAGLAQHFVNIDGYLPGKKIIILGSGDIGLIMARRLTLEGAEVLGVYEVKSEPSGLERNIAQCLHDYNIPLHLSCTVKTVHGNDRVTGVTVVHVNEKGDEISGTEEYIACDCLILSVGLIPENEIAQNLNVPLDASTKGPFVDQSMHTLVDGIFACGNAVHVHELVDYVSESGEIAGKSAALWIREKKPRALLHLAHDDTLLYHVPQFINTNLKGGVSIFFRSRKAYTQKINLCMTQKNTGTSVFLKKYSSLRPSEMEKVVLFDISQITANMTLGLEGLYE